MLWRARLALTAPVFLLLAGCDLDDLLGNKKPPAVEGAKELAGSWSCQGSGGAGALGAGPRGAAVEASLALLRDGTATSVSTSRWAQDGAPAEMSHMQRLKWRRKADKLDFEITYSVVTKYVRGGRNQDLGEANKAASLALDLHPETKTSVSRVSQLTGDRLVLDEPNGGRTRCTRRT